MNRRALLNSTITVLAAGVGLWLLWSGPLAPDHRPALAQGVCPPVQNTPSFTIVYGTALANGLDAPLGTAIEARSPRGDVVGCFVVADAGDYGAMYVYGEDTSVTPALPGMRSGEAISFRLDGAAAAADPVLAWAGDRDLHQVDLSATTTATETRTVGPGDAPPVDFGGARLALDCAAGPGGTVTVRLPMAYPAA